jgi:hypothetical protein
VPVFMLDAGPGGEAAGPLQTRIEAIMEVLT